MVIVEHKVLQQYIFHTVAGMAQERLLRSYSHYGRL